MCSQPRDPNVLGTTETPHDTGESTDLLPKGSHVQKGTRSESLSVSFGWVSLGSRCGSGFHGVFTLRGSLTVNWGTGVLSRTYAVLQLNGVKRQILAYSDLSIFHSSVQTRGGENKREIGVRVQRRRRKKEKMKIGTHTGRSETLRHERRGSDSPSPGSLR